MRYLTLSLSILFTCCSVLVASELKGQNIHQVMVDISVSEKSLLEALRQIEASSVFRFAYKPDNIKEYTRLNLPKGTRSVAQTLDLLLARTKLTYKQRDNYIILELRSKPQEVLPQKSVKREVRGTVRDSVGVLPGVSVTVKGTKIGTATDENGRYILDIPDDEAVLVFTMVGFKTEEVSVKGQEVINVILRPSGKDLDEVVVVAFGKQKRSDMVGSVASINPAQLKVPASNLTTALAGRISGVIAYQRSGEPGRDNADFFIRGVTTFGYKKDPLILIDGMEVTTTDLARIQVDDIANFSVLKDATATALYGSRAANGIILIKTKEGAVRKARLNFRMENSISAPTQNVELADPVTYMKLSNEATLTRDPLGHLLYSDRKIENTVPGSDSFIYPANDWRELMFKDYTMNQRANVNISGGGGVARYFVAGSFNKDNGLMKVDPRSNFNNNIDLKSYTLRSNVNINLTKTTELAVRLSGNFDDYNGPIDGGESMYRKVMRANPVLFPAYYPMTKDYEHLKHPLFGNYDEGNYLNPYADMVKGYRQYSRSLMLAQLELNQDLKFVTEGLTFSGMMNTNRRSFLDVRRSYSPFWYTMGGYDNVSGTYSLTNINPESGTEYLNFSQQPMTAISSFYMESRLNYNRNFNKHGFTGLLVTMMQSQLEPDPSDPDLQKSLPKRNLSLSGKAAYNYDSKYYIDFNFGYNGSERFNDQHRFGFFPALGLAWTASNEKFFEKYKNVVSNLRLRATYGIIGNDAIGAPEDRFFYLSNVDMNNAGRGAGFGREPGTQYRRDGILVSRYANPYITWETSEQQNLALELGLFGRFNLNAEYFSQYRSNILMTRGSVPLEAGFSAPIMANVGEASAKGIDVSLDYAHSFANGLTISGLGNFTYATNKFRAYEEPKYNEAYRYHVGNPIDQTYGYIAERLFVDDAEAANSPRQNFGEYGGGDVKYLDVNRDGQITEADKVPIGNPTKPEIVFGFGFTTKFKGLDLSAFFQGLANESFWIDPRATAPFASYRYPDEVSGGLLTNRVLNNQLLKAYADSYWSEDRRDVYALWPRLSSTVNQNNSQHSTWFMRDGSFLRLKQVEVGYTLPQRLQEKIHTSLFRVYVNASNLLTFSKFDLWDVEMGENGLGYPVQRIFNIGINIGIN